MLFDMTTDSILLQREKAQIPILVTLLGMMIVVSPLQYAKACPPMVTTLLGMDIEVRPLQFWNILNIDNQQITF